MLIREGRKWGDMEEPLKETAEQPWGRVLVAPQGISRTISLGCSADTETPLGWEKLKVRVVHKQLDPRLVETRRLMMLTPTYLTTNQSEEGP